MKSKIIYLDNAATTWPKPSNVIREMDKCVSDYCANPGRGAHQMSLRCSEQIFETREAVASLFNVSDSNRVVFTKNCTEALNMAIYGYLKRGDHVITSKLEHNSVMRPLNDLKTKGIIDYVTIGNSINGQITVDDLKLKVKSNTKLIIINHSSNVTGIIQDIESIGKFAEKMGICLLIDAAQTAGTVNIDMTKMKIDMLAFAGHKSMYGPQGTGGLVISDKYPIIPLLKGGTGSDSRIIIQPRSMPDGFESGTLNTPGIVGLGEGLKYVKEVGIENIKRRKALHVDKIIQSFLDNRNIKILSEIDAKRNSGIVSFNINGIAAEEAAYLYDKKYNIACRAGLHCSPAAHTLLGTLDIGCVRISPSAFTSKYEIDLFLQATREIIQMK